MISFKDQPTLPVYFFYFSIHYFIAFCCRFLPHLLFRGALQCRMVPTQDPLWIKKKIKNILNVKSGISYWDSLAVFLVLSFQFPEDDGFKPPPFLFFSFLSFLFLFLSFLMSTIVHFFCSFKWQGVCPDFLPVCRVGSYLLLKGNESWRNLSSHQDYLQCDWCGWILFDEKERKGKRDK